jgi:hypothetical protein
LAQSVSAAPALARRSPARNLGHYIIPSIAFDVPCPELGHRFSWSEHYNRYLDKLAIPLAPSDTVLAALPAVDPKRGLEHAVVNALRHRRPQVVFLDETNHFASVTSAKVLFDQTNRIKAFVSRTQVPHVCFGTYEVARMPAVSGQLARRSDIIHLPRYRAESDADCADFRGVIKAFQKHLPVAHHLDLTTKSKFLHERSIGLVGVLKGWLLKALSVAHSCGRSEITVKDLEDTASPVRSLQIMLDEARKGELSLEEASPQLTLFREELGHAKAADVGSALVGELFSTGSSSSPRPKSKAKPFEPAPARLPTGGAFNGELGKLAG